MLDRRIKLRHLDCFLEIARTRSLSKSADRLNLTQPAISKTLKEFEGILGVRLIERSRRGATLTAYGTALLPAASAGLQQLEQAVSSVSMLQARERMVVRVGALPTVAASILPGAIEAFQRSYPESSFRLISGPYDFLLSQLRDRAVDIVIGRMADPEKLHGLSFNYIYSEQVVFLVRAGHPLLAAPAFDPKDIARYQLIMPDESAIIRRSVDQLLQVLRIDPPVSSIETVAHSFSRVYTIESNAVWIISEGVAAHDIATGALCKLPTDTEVSKGAVGYTLRVEAEIETATRLFVETLVDQNRGA